MPLDPQAQMVLEQTAALGLPPAHTVSPEEARANGKLRPRAPGPEVSAVQDRSIPGPDSDVPVRIYTPEGAMAPSLCWSGTTAAAGWSAILTPPTAPPGSYA